MLKVKEPQPAEVALLREGQTLFTYLHLAAEPELARGLMASGATCIAYETVEDADGRLPLLAPMSEVAGKIATQAGAFMLEKPLGGRGILLGGVPGVAAATVLVIGGGVVGMNAAFIAIGMQADVFVFDRSIDRLRELEVAFAGRASTVYSSTLAIEEMLPLADLVIGAVLVHGGRAPHVVTREQLKLMKRHAVLVDVSIDQGGCFETSRPTTHSDPTFEVDGITHYCVTNMPGAVPITSTYALTNATLPYVIELAEHGVDEALERNRGLRLGAERARRRDHPPGRRRGARRAGASRGAVTARELDASETRATPPEEEIDDGEHRRDPAATSSTASASRPTGETEPVLNPATGEELARAPVSTRRGRRPRGAGRARGVRRLVAARRPRSARRRCWRWPTRSRSTARRSRAWRRSTRASRSRRSTNDEIPVMADNLRFFAGAARCLEGRAAGEYMEGYTSFTRREAVGVIGQITPWNYPLMMAIWKIRPGAGGGQHGRAEAGRDDADHDRAAGRAGRRHPAEGRAERASPARAEPTGRGADQPPRRGHGRADRVGGDGQAHRAHRGGHAQARAPRARRQGAGGRVRRRQPRERARDDRRHRLLQRRPGLHGGHARAGRERRSTTTSSRAWPSRRRGS